MNSNSARIGKSSIVTAIVLSAIRQMRTRHFAELKYKKTVINADLVPSLPEKIIKPKIISQGLLSPRPKRNKHMHVLVQPIPLKPTPMPQAQHRALPAPQFSPSSISQDKDYGKLTGLLRDQSITYIECLGPDKPITLIRAGQKQFTKIVLNAPEIKKFLENVSVQTHIPLMEGIFKAAVDNFIVNAIISDVIGSRFIIKKQTPYSLLGR